MNFNLRKLKYKKFKSKNLEDTKILLITSKYFLIGEIIKALNILGFQYDTIILETKEYLTEKFISTLIEKISSFKPDFTFTINHLGIDREGILMEFFEKIQMPILSWYVDNPNLIIRYYRKNISDYCCILTWDKDNIEDMKNIGFKNVYYLPLATDHTRFKYIPIEKNIYKTIKRDICFVGKSMIDQVNDVYEKCIAPESFKKLYRKIAVDFEKSSIRSVSEFLKRNYFEIYKIFEKLPEESKTYFETLVTWEATRIYRYKCVKSIVKFKPLIVGDNRWKKYFRDKIYYFPEVNYYEDLPFIYNLAEINFNTTSMQMKNAVNQRVFDVPACRRFIITDYRKQIEDLFEIDKEVVCYKSIDEIPDLVEKYLKDKKEREKIIENAYKRVMNEHKYTDRVMEIIKIAKKIYS